MTEWRFVAWSDGSKENPRAINLYGDLSFCAVYEQAPPAPPRWPLLLVIPTGLFGILLLTSRRGKKRK